MPVRKTFAPNLLSCTELCHRSEQMVNKGCD